MVFTRLSPQLSVNTDMPWGFFCGQCRSNSTPVMYIHVYWFLVNAYESSGSVFSSRKTTTRGKAITVECLNEGHTLCGSIVSFVRRLSSLGGPKCFRTIGRKYIGDSSWVLCREDVLIWGVHYQILYMMPI